jgi:hypothetical protein
VSFTAFAITQVGIDLETLYHLVRRDWPVHRELHTIIGGCCVGLVVAGVVVLARPMMNRVLPRPFGAGSLRPIVVAEWSGMAAVVGGLIGGASHSLLDAMMHSDARPFWPVVDANGLLGLIGPGLLQALCVVSGVVGLAFLWWACIRQRPVV